MSQRTDTSATAATIDLPDCWGVTDTTQDTRVRYEWHRPDGTLVTVWVIERDETNESSDFRLRAATLVPESLIKYNAYEVCQYRSTESALQSAGEFVEYFTERLENGPEKERPLHVRVEKTITAFQHRGEGEKIVDALRRWSTVMD